MSLMMPDTDDELDLVEPPMAVIDCFCGLGGCSVGFVQEGFALECAVDNERVALAELGANAGVGRQVLRCVTLKTDGDWTAEADLPPARAGLHFHASAPCTEMATAKRKKDAAGFAAGLALFRTAIETPLLRGDATWTSEQVPNKVAVELVQAFEAKFPRRVAHVVLDASDIACPSSRRRLIVGDPLTIQNLKQEPTSRVSIAQAFAAYGVSAKPNAESVGVMRGPSGCAKTRTLADVAPCVTASHPLTFFDAQNKSLGCLTPAHSAALMGFPKTWSLPKKQRAAQCAVGNAIPVALSAAMARAAKAAIQSQATGVATPISKEALTAIKPTTPPTPVSTHESEARALADELDALASRALHLAKRLRQMDHAAAESSSSPEPTSSEQTTGSL